eukprot:6398318-Alexandrium_andersonii.AAC.1
MSASLVGSEMCIRDSPSITSTALMTSRGLLANGPGHLQGALGLAMFYTTALTNTQINALVQ